MIKIENIIKKYGSKEILHGISMKFNQSDITAILGPNGSGKTTAFYIICGLTRQNSGDVSINGTIINDVTMSTRALIGIGYLPQDVSVFQKLTAEDNIKAALELRNLSKADIKREFEYLTEEFALSRFIKTKAELLSGGEKRRVEIARILATNPKYILLDEPFAGVDPVSVEDINKILLKIKSKGIGVIITDHNVTEALKIIDVGYILYNGNIIFHGKPDEIKKDKEVKRVYLGESFN
jgi:lipopolysaccharide export system ATP-binding protein